MSLKRKVVFIDRDGVINHDSPEYIKSEDEFVFIEGSPDAFGLLEKNGLEAVIITNQSVIGRKLVSPEGLERIFEKMRKGINEAGGRILDIFFCPHVPEDRCGCRKPEPGLLEAAAQKYGIDMNASFMIGDSSKDLAAAEKAGIGIKILVRTGNGEKTLAKIRNGEISRPDYVAANLLDAVSWIISRV
jgi:D-glycero-D-manno-heptose 1,7-bisphosphate phosphatase